MNCALKTGRNTSNVHRHMANTHIETHALEGWAPRVEDMLMESPSQTVRQTGPHRSLLGPDSQETHQAQRDERPESRLTMLLFLLKTY